MSVTCTGKYLLIEVIHEGVTYECVTSSDLKNLYECTPDPESWTGIENLIREAAWRGDVQDLDLLG
jgi:hypothetical protein